MFLQRYLKNYVVLTLGLLLANQSLAELRFGPAPQATPTSETTERWRLPATRAHAAQNLQAYTLAQLARPTPPDPATATRQELAAYFAQNRYSDTDILNLQTMYLYPEFVQLARQLPGYNAAITKLHQELATTNPLTRLWRTLQGTYTAGLAEQVAKLYEALPKAPATPHLSSNNASKTKLPALDHQTQLALLENDRSDWQYQLATYPASSNSQHQIYLRQRCQALTALQTDGPVTTTQKYLLTPALTDWLTQHQQNPSAYATSTGHQLQQVLQQECVDLLTQTAGLTPLSPLYQHQQALLDFVSAANAYNHAGGAHQAAQINDLCWSLLEYGQAVTDGVVQGLNSVAQTIVDHPIETLAYAVAGEYLLAYQLGRVVHDLAGIGIVALRDPAQAQAQWDDYIAPLTQLIQTIQQRELSVTEAVKTGTSLAVAWRAQGRLLKGLNKFYSTTKTQALQFAKQHPTVLPQQYLATAEGQVLKAVDPNKLSRRQRRLEREEVAKTPIKEFLGELPPQNFEKALKYATKQEKLDHFFINHPGQFSRLIIKAGDEKTLVAKIIKACAGKLPKSGEFKEIPVEIFGTRVYIRGTVIDNVPYLGTMFIK